MMATVASTESTRVSKCFSCSAATSYDMVGRGSGASLGGP